MLTGVSNLNSVRHSDVKNINYTQILAAPQVKDQPLPLFESRPPSSLH